MQLQQKRAGNNSNIPNDEIVAINDKLLEYKPITPIEHNKKFKKFHLLHTKYYLYKYIHSYTLSNIANKQNNNMYSNMNNSITIIILA